MEVAVIVGAGRTGRGFIARLLINTNYKIVFVDISSELVARLNEDQGYSIHYFDRSKPSVAVKGFNAFLLFTDEALQAMAAADMIFTSVGEQHLPSLTDYFLAAERHRRNLQISTPLRILTCENGTAPGKVLKKALNKATNHIIVSESAIFCSTIELPGSQLDILSEAYDELPYDAHLLQDFKKVPAMTAVYDFQKLLQQKIFTYNCISACIAYLGAFKRYSLYGDAANDPEIKPLLERILDPLNYAISITLDIPLAEQTRFSRQALIKFADRNISDTIDRNARDVIRKLGPQERMVAPALMIMKTRGDATLLALVIAAALCYDAPTEAALHQEIRQNGAVSLFCRISGIPIEHPLTVQVEGFFRLLTQADRTDPEVITHIMEQGKDSHHG